MDKKQLIVSFFSAIFNALEPFFAGNLTRYGAAAQAALKAAVTKSDHGLDDVLALYRNYESSHPIVQTVTTDAQILLEKAGIMFVDAQTLETAIKAAIHDLAAPFEARSRAATSAASTEAVR